MFKDYFSRLLDSARTSSLLILNEIKFLQNKINEEEFADTAKVFFSDIGNNLLGDYLNEIKSIKSDFRGRIVRTHQLRDEAVQISAILKSINTQAFGGTPPLLNTTFESGIYSLLGIGGAFLSLLSIYAHVRDVFSAVNAEMTIIKSFHSMASPDILRNPTDGEYMKWKIRLGDFKGLEDENSEIDGNANFHLIYFSNRLGYRQTKHSITAAYQSLCLSYFPFWSLCTLSHEFLHAHVGSLLSTIYPLEGGEQGQIIPSAYAFYKDRLNNTDSPNNLLQYIQYWMLITVQKLYEVEPTQQGADRRKHFKVLDESALFKQLKKHKHQIDEIIVHVLDFQYFYRSDTDLYIKAIWTSWLSLPVSISRIQEYLIRTICAISPKFGRSDRNEVFKNCVDKIRKQLQELKQFNNFINPEMIDKIIDELNNTKKDGYMQLQYVNAWAPLIDVVMQFLFSPAIKDGLISDSEAEAQEDGSYSYNFDAGNFDERRIQSPIIFLLDMLRKTMDPDTINNISMEKLEFNTLWLFLVSSSALKKY